MSNNNFIIDGSISVSNVNTPTRAGQRISSLAELETIPTPFIGMIVFVEDIDKFIYVTSLKSQKVGIFEMEDLLVDQYEFLIKNDDLNLNWNEVL